MNTVDITIEFQWDKLSERPTLLRDLETCMRGDEEITVVVNTSSPPLHCTVDSVSQGVGSTCRGGARVHLRAQQQSAEERARRERLAHAERKAAEWQAVVMDLRDEGSAR